MRLFAIAASAALLLAGAADASHNRGSVLIPSVDSSGNLTIEATSFWRTTFVDAVNSVSITVPGGATFGLNMGPDTVNTADSRFTRVDETASTDVSNFGAGLYTISWSSCCRAGGISNAANANMGTTSTIFWDGSSATKPVQFDIQNIQPNVVRGSAYSDNLDATSPDGATLSYNDSYTPVGISSQAPGFSISNTGQITIPATDTAGYPENPTAGNPGADVAFYGQIIATDGGRQTASVQFDWLFDAVAAGSNQVPDVADVVVNATVGDMINENILGTDPNGDPVTLTFLSFNGPGGAIPGSSFNPGTPAANMATTGNFMWDSTGFAAGTYIATIQGSDGALTDQGTITINLTKGGTPPPGVIPLPAGFVLMTTALGGLGLLRRRRRS
ncbi:VPLPA-CTERM sorting domain-containing protein [Sulfitobacter sp. D35]|uniref:VPLPA-CTERM sorting domain-containing protein n=1 Tax=Sulfitobacter sp. D35 TaxID=3083252 RepID=UPI00296FE4CE|nr:VPLPA-CTERM sorting domain-containing protein [Sulfitobacter sp. D35]MDW4496836.1 VPLPA-CTERM sorting domain-containing protein [Sulfitobacter sp. D35]